jgi:hypothetical protein
LVADIARQFGQLSIEKSLTVEQQRVWQPELEVCQQHEYVVGILNFSLGHSALLRVRHLGLV